MSWSIICRYLNPPAPLILTPLSDLSVHGSISPAAGRAPSVARNHRSTLHTLPTIRGRQTIESHPAEPGPEFVLTKFDLSGHSPLVEYYLREKNLAKDIGISKLLTRKEISSYPSLEGQTYRQLINESRKRVKGITRDVNKFWEERRRIHIRTTNENQAQRQEFQQRCGKLLDNPNVVSKLAEMIVNDRLHGGGRAKISHTIDSLIAQQDENEDKAQ